MKFRNDLFLIFSGKVEFDAEEDAHVVGDCVKVLMLVLIIVKSKDTRFDNRKTYSLLIFL